MPTPRLPLRVEHLLLRACPSAVLATHDIVSNAVRRGTSDEEVIEALCKEYNCDRFGWPLGPMPTGITATEPLTVSSTPNRAPPLPEPANLARRRRILTNYYLTNGLPIDNIRIDVLCGDYTVTDRAILDALMLKYGRNELGEPYPLAAIEALKKAREHDEHDGGTADMTSLAQEIALAARSTALRHRLRLMFARAAPERIAEASALSTSVVALGPDLLGEGDVMAAARRALGDNIGDDGWPMHPFERRAARLQRFLATNDPALLGTDVHLRLLYKGYPGSSSPSRASHNSSGHYSALAMTEGSSVSEHALFLELYHSYGRDELGRPVGPPGSALLQGIERELVAARAEGLIPSDDGPKFLTSGDAANLAAKNVLSLNDTGMTCTPGTINDDDGGSIINAISDHLHDGLSAIKPQPVPGARDEDRMTRISHYLTLEAQLRAQQQALQLQFPLMLVDAGCRRDVTELLSRVVPLAATDDLVFACLAMAQRRAMMPAQLLTVLRLRHQAREDGWPLDAQRRLQAKVLRYLMQHAPQDVAFVDTIIKEITHGMPGDAKGGEQSDDMLPMEAWLDEGLALSRLYEKYGVAPDGSILHNTPAIRYRVAELLEQYVQEGEIERLTEEAMQLGLPKDELLEHLSKEYAAFTPYPSVLRKQLQLIYARACPNKAYQVDQLMRVKRIERVPDSVIIKTVCQKLAVDPDGWPNVERYNQMKQAKPGSTWTFDPNVRRRARIGAYLQQRDPARLAQLELILERDTRSEEDIMASLMEQYGYDEEGAPFVTRRMVVEAARAEAGDAASASISPLSLSPYSSSPPRPRAVTESSPLDSLTTYKSPSKAASTAAESFMNKISRYSWLAPGPH